MPYTDVKKGFGLAIKRWRGNSGISQEELAWRAGLHRSYLADIERGARNVSLQSIDKLAKALKLSLSTLFEPLDPSAEQGSAQGGSTETVKPVDILLVEDDPRDVELTLNAFRTARLTNRVEVVRDGAQALDYIFCRGTCRRRKRTEGPEVILLDLSLPTVHGLDVLREIKADRQARKSHVVVLTTSRLGEDMREALHLGAEASLLKPVDFNQLTAITPLLDLCWTLRPPREPVVP